MIDARPTPTGSKAIVIALSLLLMALACVPWLLHADPEFRSDDFFLIARGVEDDVFSGLLRHLTRPFGDTWTIEFYRPLFTWSFCVEGHLFGDDPWPYFIENVIWHALAVMLGFLVARRLLGTRWAFLSAVLFTANPWACNNVLWLSGRCTTVSTALLFLGVLLYLRAVDRNRFPRGALICSAIAVFYRETALFLPVLVALIDMAERRRDRKAFMRWVVLGLPFIVYMGAKINALGTWLGGYVRLEALRGDPPLDMSQRLATVGEAALQLLIPGNGAMPLDFGDPVWWGGVAAVIALIALAIFGRGIMRGPALMMLAFGVLHAAPMLAVDPSVHAAASQRWFTVMWAVAVFLVALARHGRWPIASVILVLGLAASGAWRLHGNLEDYDASAEYSRRIRAAIAAAPRDHDVFVYNISDRFGAAPFYAVGLGLTAVPPFGEREKPVYPVLANYPFQRDKLMVGGQAIPPLAPVASVARATGHLATVFFCEAADGSVTEVPGALLDQGVGLLQSMPRLQVRSPASTPLDDVSELTLDVEVSGLERLDIYLMTPIAQMRLTRRRGRTYSNGTFSDDGTRYTENLRPLLEYATLFVHPSRGRCWLWMCGYGVDDSRPASVSNMYELRSTVPQEEPAR